MNLTIFIKVVYLGGLWIALYSYTLHKYSNSFSCEYGTKKSFQIQGSFRDVTDRVKEQAILSELISKYIEVKPVIGGGTGSFVSLCPFHDDKNPSLRISDIKRLYHCFSCNAGGDVISFVKEFEKLSYKEAVLKIIKLENLDIELQPNDPTSDKDFDWGLNDIDLKRDRLQKILNKAADFYTSKLIQDVRAGGARSYLKSRVLSAKTVYLFQLGYAPSFSANTKWTDTLVGNLTAQGFLLEDIIESGLAICKSDTTLMKFSSILKKDFSSKRIFNIQEAEYSSYSRDIYERFRDRLMIPIKDHRSIITGFGGRLISLQTQDVKNIPKYLNSPDSILFKKGSGLFGIDNAKRALGISSCPGALLVEGYFDVMSLHDCDVKYAVGVLGTALSKEQLELALRFTNDKTLILLLDNDDAGTTATRRLCRQVIPLLSDDVNVKVATFDSAIKIYNSIFKESTLDESIIIKDASDLVSALSNPCHVSTIIQELIRRAVGFRQWIVDDIIKKTVSSLSDQKDPQSISRAINLVVDFIANDVPSPADRTLLIYYVSERLGSGSLKVQSQLETDLFDLVSVKLKSAKTNKSYLFEKRDESKPQNTQAKSAVYSSKTNDGRPLNFIDGKLRLSLPPSKGRLDNIQAPTMTNVKPSNLTIKSSQRQSNINENFEIVDMVDNNDGYLFESTSEKKQRNKRENSYWRPLSGQHIQDVILRTASVQQSFEHIRNNELNLIKIFVYRKDLRRTIHSRLLQLKDLKERLKCIADDVVWHFSYHAKLWDLICENNEIDDSVVALAPYDSKNISNTATMLLQEYLLDNDEVSPLQFSIGSVINDTSFATKNEKYLETVILDSIRVLSEYVITQRFRQLFRVYEEEQVLDPAIAVELDELLEMMSSYKKKGIEFRDVISENLSEENIQRNTSNTFFEFIKQPQNTLRQSLPEDSEISLYDFLGIENNDADEADETIVENIQKLEAAGVGRRMFEFSFEDCGDCFLKEGELLPDEVLAFSSKDNQLKHSCEPQRKNKVPRQVFDDPAVRFDMYGRRSKESQSNTNDMKPITMPPKRQLQGPWKEVGNTVVHWDESQDQFFFE